MKAESTSKSPRWGRRIASVLILWQLWAIFGRPLEFATQGPTGVSRAAEAFYTPVRWYSEFAYLNHGYAFFAPDPGPSHLIAVRYRSTNDANSNNELPAEAVIYPNLQQQWPRLLYHRHFMLTEFLHNTHQPAQLPPELANDEAIRRSWSIDRGRHEAIYRSMQQHLASRYGVDADAVDIRRLEHRLVGLPEFIEDPRRMDDPELMIDLTAADQPPPEYPQFGAPRMQWPGAPPLPGNATVPAGSPRQIEELPR